MQRIVRIVLVICLGLSSCVRPEKMAGPEFQAIARLDSASALTIHNTGNKEICFQLNVGNGPGCPDALLDRIAAMSDEFPNEGLERKAWRYVMGNTQYLPAYSEERTAHSPLILFNSLGFGQCDDLAAALVHVWRLQGFDARVWTLDGHVVPEVLIDGRWQMFDPSFQAYYLNDNGLVAGVEELSLKPGLITAPFKRLELATFNNMDGQVIDSLRYTPFVAAYYAQGGRNEVSTWYDSTIVLSEMKLCIPAGSIMELPHREQGIVSTHDWQGAETDRSHFIRLRLEKSGSQRISIPYALVATSGKGISDRIGQVWNSSEPLFLVDTDLWVDADPGDRLYFYLNSQLTDVQDLRIELCANDTAAAEVIVAGQGNTSVRVPWVVRHDSFSANGCCK